MENTRLIGFNWKSLLKRPMGIREFPKKEYGPNPFWTPFYRTKGTLEKGTKPWPCPS